MRINFIFMKCFFAKLNKQTMGKDINLLKFHISESTILKFNHFPFSKHLHSTLKFKEKEKTRKNNKLKNELFTQNVIIIIVPMKMYAQKSDFFFKQSIKTK